jgi:hypothetical protein
LTDGQAKRQGRIPDGAPNLPSEAQKRRFGRFAAAGQDLNNTVTSTRKPGARTLAARGGSAAPDSIG